MTYPETKNTVVRRGRSGKREKRKKGSLCGTKVKRGGNIGEGADLTISGDRGLSLSGREDFSLRESERKT